jgi:redox-sensitive bicupin YhaK (pirin superfamily)
MVQLWVNLRASDKGAAPGYQAIAAAAIPVVGLPEGAGSVRVIAGTFGGATGPARTFSSLNVWDVALVRDAAVDLELPAGQTALIAVLGGHVTLNGGDGAGEAEVVRLERDGTTVALRADGDSRVLVLTGEPLDEPVVGHGPFVMTSEAEIRAAIDDFNAGRFGPLSH